MNQQLESLRFRITKRFGSKTVLDDFALAVRGRQFVTLLGPSGCGKSTALNIVAGLIPASEGELWIDEQRIDHVPPERRGFGMVFQNYALFPHMTVLGNIAFGLELQRRPAAEIKERVRAMLQLVHLPELEDRYPSQLSGGQQQRVAIARALVLHPRLLLLDEPLSNLDAKLRVEMRAEIKRIHASLGLTCIYVTHDQTEALSLSDWVVVMRDGAVMQAGPPSDIYNRPANVFVADFMGFRNFFRGEIRHDGQLQLSNASIASRDNTLKPGQHATAAIRPEDVQVGGDGAGANQFRGRVEIVEYLGRDNEAVLRLEDQSALWVHTKAHLAPGDVVPVSFPTDKVIFLPDTPGLPRMKTREPRQLDLTAILCLLPSVIFVVGMFVYPFLRGVYLSVRPAKEPGLSLANYVAFFSDEWQYGTIWITFSIAIPTTILVVLSALFLAYGMRGGIRMERTITTILVLPVSLGVILLSIGIQGFYGSRGWFNQLLVGAGVLSEPLQLTNNKTGVMLSLFMQQFPFCFLMLLGYISGIDPTLERSARTLGAGPWAVFRRVMLPLMAPGIAIAFALVFVMTFAVFPSAILLGQPAGATRTIAIAAYHQAFEHYDMSYASAIAVIMGCCQLAGLFLIILLRQRMVTAPTMGVGKR